MGFDKVMALYWDFWLIPYYKVYVKTGKKVVKIFNQKVVNSDKSSLVRLTDKSNNLGWWINDDYIEHKAKIIYIVDLNNAIPLKIISVIESSANSVFGDIIINEKTTKKVVIDTEKQKIKKASGKPENLISVLFPPSLFFDIIDAHVVEEALSEPPSKWKELAPVLIIAIISGAALLYYMMSSGGLKGLGG